MNKKLLCGLTALGLFTSVAMAQGGEPPIEPVTGGYYLFEYKGQDATNENNPWGGNIMGFAYNSATSNNDPDPAGGDGILVFEDGVAKIKNGGWSVVANVYPGIFIAIEYPGSGSTPIGNPGNCINGFSYYYKSNTAHTFALEFPISNCTGTYGNKWKKEDIAAENSWTKVTYALNQFGDNDAAGCGTTVPKDVAIIKQISWGFEGGVYAPGDGPFTDIADTKFNINLEIANVACLGSAIDPCLANPNLPQCQQSIMLPNGTVISGLNVVPFARSLQITSAKDATVSLFDMNGKQVFSKKVAAGQEIVSLANQKQGVYYAVVQSGSLKQTVKVVLK